MESLRFTTAWCQHWTHVPSNLCSRACQLRLDRSVWHSQDSGCLRRDTENSRSKSILPSRLQTENMEHNPSSSKEETCR